MPDICSAVVAEQGPESPLVRQLLYAGKQVGTVAHVIVVAMPKGAAPGPGVGWHTLCTTRWADGARTHEDGWGFGRQGDAPLCRGCEKASRQSGARDGEGS
jgi:hypothetical protein